MPSPKGKRAGCRYGKIWRHTGRDSDFRRLSTDGRLVWLMLCGQPDIRLTGLVEWVPELLALSTGLSVDAVKVAVDELARFGFVSVDFGTSELLVGNYVRLDAFEDSPNMVKAMWLAYSEILSFDLREAFLDRLPPEVFRVEWGCPSVFVCLAASAVPVAKHGYEPLVGVVSDHPSGLISRLVREVSGHRQETLPEPFRNPSGRVSDTDISTNEGQTSFRTVFEGVEGDVFPGQRAQTGVDDMPKGKGSGTLSEPFRNPSGTVSDTDTQDNDHIKSSENEKRDQNFLENFFEGVEGDVFPGKRAQTGVDDMPKGNGSGRVPKGFRTTTTTTTTLKAKTLTKSENESKTHEIEKRAIEPRAETENGSREAIVESSATNATDLACSAPSDLDTETDGSENTSRAKNSSKTNETVSNTPKSPTESPRNANGTIPNETATSAPTADLDANQGTRDPNLLPEKRKETKTAIRAAARITISRTLNIEPDSRHITQIANTLTTEHPELNTTDLTNLINSHSDTIQRMYDDLTNRDELFEATAVAVGWNPTELSPPNASRVGKFVRDIAIPTHATAQEIHARASRWTDLFPNATFTISAFEKHWDSLSENGVAKAAPKQNRNGRIADSHGVATVDDWANYTGPIGGSLDEILEGFKGPKT